MNNHKKPALDLFSGVGMYALGAERAGFDVVGFCERDTEKTPYDREKGKE